jgi:malonyl CoA-acyl carrier protein transacylase
VSAPFHCSLMDPAARIMASALNAVEFRDPDIEVISNVTAKPVSRVVVKLISSFNQVKKYRVYCRGK